MKKGLLGLLGFMSLSAFILASCGSNNKVDSTGIGDWGCK